MLGHDDLADLNLHIIWLVVFRGPSLPWELPGGRPPVWFFLPIAEWSLDVLNCYKLPNWETWKLNVAFAPLRFGGVHLFWPMIGLQMLTLGKLNDYFNYCDKFAQTSQGFVSLEKFPGSDQPRLDQHPLSNLMHFMYFYFIFYVFSFYFFCFFVYFTIFPCFSFFHFFILFHCSHFFLKKWITDEVRRRRQTWTKDTKMILPLEPPLYWHQSVPPSIQRAVKKPGPWTQAKTRYNKLSQVHSRHTFSNDTWIWRPNGKVTEANTCIDLTPQSHVANCQSNETDSHHMLSTVSQQASLQAKASQAEVFFASNYELRGWLRQPLTIGYEFACGWTSSVLVFLKICHLESVTAFKDSQLFYLNWLLLPLSFAHLHDCTAKSTGILLAFHQPVLVTSELIPMPPHQGLPHHVHWALALQHGHAIERAPQLKVLLARATIWSHVCLAFDGSSELERNVHSQAVRQNARGGLFDHWPQSK